MNCPDCTSKRMVDLPRYTYVYWRCLDCGRLWTTDLKGEPTRLIDPELAEKIVKLEKNLYEFRDFHVSADLGSRHLYNEWLELLCFLSSERGREIREYLRKMEYKRGGEVWQKTPPKGWREAP